MPTGVRNGIYFAALMLCPVFFLIGSYAIFYGIKGLYTGKLPDSQKALYAEWRRKGHSEAIQELARRS